MNHIIYKYIVGSCVQSCESFRVINWFLLTTIMGACILMLFDHSRNESLSLSNKALQLRTWMKVRIGLIAWLLMSYLGLTLSGSSVSTTVIIIFSLVLIAINILTQKRLANSLPIVNGELFFQYILDILLLTGFFYATEGANNPFVSYLLVPLCFAAATLPRNLSVILTLIALFCYASLFILVAPHDHSSAVAQYHIIGMWFTFLISASLIVFFIGDMSQHLQRQSNKIHHLHHLDTQKERVFAVASLAATTCHELGTPLNNMRLLLDEIKNADCTQEVFQADLLQLSHQLNRCTTILKNISNAANIATETTQTVSSIEQLLKPLLHSFSLLNPNLTVDISSDTSLCQMSIPYSQDLPPVINNILNNAVDAKATHIQCNISNQKGMIAIQFSDNGDGIHSSIEDQIGENFLPSERGMGIGLYLSKFTLRRLGGELSLLKNSQRGTVVKITLPEILNHAE